MALFYGEASPIGIKLLSLSPQKKPFSNERFFSLFLDSNQKRWPGFEHYHRGLLQEDVGRDKSLTLRLGRRLFFNVSFFASYIH